MDMRDVITTVVGRPVTAEDVIVHLKADGTFRNAIYQLIEVQVIALKCEELKITCSEEDFRDYADTKRRLMGLFSAEDMNRYCKWYGIVMSQWNEMVRNELLRTKLQKKIITDADVGAYFEDHKNDFYMATLSRIVCPDEEQAQAALGAIRDDGDDFAAVARKVSIEKNTRAAGGYLGSVKYGTLPRAINDAVFSENPGSVLGPFEQSGYWTIYRIEEVKNTELDDAQTKNISDQLFTRWLKDEVLSVKA
ncbi:MAG: peptidylprolyl isomerase [Gammaproteobacteria bacterium]